MCPFRRSRVARVQSCLLAHIDKLSPHCKCFVQQTLGERLAAHPPPLPIAAPSARPLAQADPAAVPPSSQVMRLATPEFGVAAAPRHPLHQLSCLFFFTAMLLFSFLLVRSLVMALCGGKRPAKRVVLVPPPSEGGVQVATVQVAEPLTIKV